MNCLTLLLAAVTLTADTSNPVNSFFFKGENATVIYSVRGLAPGAKEKLTAQIFDELDKKLVDMPALEVVADEKGEWTGSASLPTERYGFYLLRAQCGEARLPKVGSRRPDCITYAVVYDPSKRKTYPDEWTFYGLCGTGPDVDRWLGTSFHYSGTTPTAPEKWAKFSDKAKAAKRKHRDTICASGQKILDEFLPPEGRAFCLRR